MVCPACITSAAAVTASVTSGGGLLALVSVRFRTFIGFRKLNQQLKEKEKQS